MKIDWENPPANDDRLALPVEVRRRLIWTGGAMLVLLIAIAVFLGMRMR